MSLELAAWATAVATVVLAVFAIVAAWYARKAFRGQSSELVLLQKQAGRDWWERRKAQAAQVFVTVGGLPPKPPDQICLTNSSGQPVYDLVAWAGNHEPMRVPVLMPGEQNPFSAGWADAGGTMPVVWFEFRDAAGLRWRTTSEGELGELPPGVGRVRERPSG